VISHIILFTTTAPLNRTL